MEVGYMNVIPKCLDSSLKYPVYENLPETYAAINEYLAEHPLEGEFILMSYLYSDFLLTMAASFCIRVNHMPI